MIEKKYIDELNQLRSNLLTAIKALNDSESFLPLLDSLAKVSERFRRLEAKCVSKLHKPFDGRFVVAIAGSSGHGKTTVIDELFPGLSRRGWLKTDVTDTTSQALRIEYDANMTATPPVVVNSWSLEQIKSMFDDEVVKKQNEANNIKVDYGDDRISVDGDKALFKEEDKKKFKFQRTMDIRAFSQPYTVPPDKLQDEAFISALTVKQSSGKITTDPLIHVDGFAFNSLQLRAVVKDVTLKDDFHKIKRWLNVSDADLENFVIVDTPGIGTSGSVKDEILSHTLEAKSRRILLELMANDELDIIVHLVLCGKQSHFSSVWRALENKIGKGEMADLSERIILAVNGTNIFFTNPDLQRHMKEDGDHLDTAIGDNILEKMAPGQNFRPESICFLDSKRIVEGQNGLLTRKSYEKVYAQYRETLESWLETNSAPYRYLEQYGWVDSFRRNLKSLLDPEDCGQGFMIQQIHRLIQDKGKKLLVKKYICRTGLHDCARELKAILGEYYDESGCLNFKATSESVAEIFSVITDTDPSAIDEYCIQNIDQDIDKITQACDGEGWLITAFENVCTHLGRTLVTQKNINQETITAFWRVLQLKVQEWCESWGYMNSDMLSPAKSSNRTLILAQHLLKTHVREMIHQFKSGFYKSDEGRLIEQSAHDIQHMQAVLSLIENVIIDSETICRKEGVNP